MRSVAKGTGLSLTRGSLVRAHRRMIHTVRILRLLGHFGNPVSAEANGLAGHSKRRHAMMGRLRVEDGQVDELGAARMWGTSGSWCNALDENEGKPSGQRVAALC